MSWEVTILNHIALQYIPTGYKVKTTSLMVIVMQLNPESHR